jgi:hypothetical protein
MKFSEFNLKKKKNRSLEDVSAKKRKTLKSTENIFSHLLADFCFSRGCLGPNSGEKRGMGIRKGIHARKFCCCDKFESANCVCKPCEKIHFVSGGWDDQGVICEFDSTNKYLILFH